MSNKLNISNNIKAKFLFFTAFLMFINLLSQSVLAQDSTGSISGVIIDENGNPISGLLVILTADYSKKRYPCSSDENGFYKINSLKEGTYNLKVLFKEPTMKNFSYINITRSNNTTQNVTIDIAKAKEERFFHSGPSFENIPDMYPNYSRIDEDCIAFDEKPTKGFIYNEYGRPIKLALIQLKQNNEIKAQAFSNSKGKYVFHYLPRGAYDLVAHYFHKNIELPNIKVSSSGLVDIYMNTSSIEDSINSLRWDHWDMVSTTVSIEHYKVYYGEKTGEVNIRFNNNQFRVDSTKIELYRHNALLRSCESYDFGDFRMNFVPSGNYTMHITHKGDLYTVDNFNVPANRRSEFMLDILDKDKADIAYKDDSDLNEEQRRYGNKSATYNKADNSKMEILLEELKTEHQKN